MARNNNNIDMKFGLCETSVREVKNCFDYLIQEMSVIRNCLKERNSPIDKQFLLQRIEFVTHLAQATQLDLEAMSYASMLQYRALMDNNNPNNMLEWRQTLDLCTNAIEKVERSDLLLMRRRRISSLSPSEKSTTEVVACNDVVKSKPITIKSKYTLNTHEIIKSAPMFAQNAILNATITYIESLDELIFYVCSSQHKEIIDLSRTKNLAQLVRLPAEGHCFGISIDDTAVMRAICDNNHSDPLYVNLIDFGEVIELGNNFKLFSLPAKYNSIPPQAIKCKLVAVRDEKQQSVQHKEFMMNKLALCEFANVRLEIKQKTANLLQVELLLDKVEATSKNPFHVDAQVADKVDKSVDKSLTSACSKSIRVVITHVLDAVRFYAQTPALESEKSCKVCWTDESVDEAQKLTKYPKVGDLVLAQYAADTFWYRAKVQQVNEEKNQITVFFVDFGNEEQVPLCSVSALLPNQMNYSFRAQLFRVADLEEYAAIDEKSHNLVMDALRVLFVNSEVDLKIRHMSANEEAVVDLVDEDMINSIDELVNDKLLRRTV